MDDLIEAVKTLLKFIEDNDIQDQMVDDGDGHMDIWTSSEFDEVLTNTQKELDKLDTKKTMKWKNIK